jgi:hypothetical protein
VAAAGPPSRACGAPCPGVPGAPGVRLRAPHGRERALRRPRPHGPGGGSGTATPKDGAATFPISGWPTASPSLPPRQNLTFTLMANAVRVASAEF